MKKRLTENITKYDDKIRVRLDSKTFIAAIISLVIAVIVYLAVNIVSFIVAITAATVTFAVCFMIQISKVDQLPLYKYIATVLTMTFDERHSRKYYTHGITSSDDYRIEIKGEKGYAKNKEKNKH